MSSTERLRYTYATEANRVIQDFTPQSGVRFKIESLGRKVSLSPPGTAVSSHVGGIGITSRSFEKVKKLLPSLSHALYHEYGKIIVLGNGLSDFALTLAKFHELGYLREEPIIVDLFDYEKLFQDFLEIAKLFVEAQLPLAPFMPDFHTLFQIKKARENHNLQAVVHEVGRDNPPACIQDAPLIVNCFGPPEHTLAQQAKLLAPGGMLLFTNIGNLHNRPTYLHALGAHYRHHTKGVMGEGETVVRRLQ